MRSQSRLRPVAAGNMIVGEGDPGTSAFILLAGECEVLVHGEVLNRVRPGELFGEIACLEGATRTASVRALVDGEVLELGGDALRSELRQSPALLDSVLRAMAHRTRDISTREAVIRDEQRRLRRVLEELQPSLDGFRDHPSLRIEVRWQPLTVASGDYYDVLELAPRRYLCALGDVMGHGAPTAPTVGMIRGQLHESARAESRPHDLLGQLHRHMRKHGPPNIFMTLTVLILDLESRTAEFASAGPPGPILYRDGASAPFTTDCGWTLGYPFENALFESSRITVASGDVILFYSDGLSDAVREPGAGSDTLGAGAMANILTSVCTEQAQGVPDAIFERVGQAQPGRRLEDDATALTVAVR